MIKKICLFICQMSLVQTAMAADFISLGNIYGATPPTSFVTDISANGMVAVGQARSPNTVQAVEAFYWSAQTSIVGIGLPHNTMGSGARGVSGDGTVITGYANNINNNAEAFRYTQSLGFQNLGFLSNGNYSVAQGISDDGTTIIGQGNGAIRNINEAFRWTEATGMVGLGDLPGGEVRSAALGVSSDGSFIVGYSSSSGNNTEAFIWNEADGMRGLGDFTDSTKFSIAYDISPDGRIVVGFAQSLAGFDAFRWSEETGMVSLGDLAGGDYISTAYAVSADGNVIVGASATGINVPGGDEAFIWDSGYGMKNIKEMLQIDYGLDLNGWVLTRALGISDDGLTIVGTGVNPFGVDQSWIVHLDKPTTVPIPAPILLFISGLISLTGIAKRKIKF